MFKRGTLVKVVKKDETKSKWHKDMNKTIGKIGVVFKVTPMYPVDGPHISHSIVVRVGFEDNSCWNYDTRCLEIVTEE